MTVQNFDSRDWADAGAPPGPVTIRMVLFGNDPRSVVPRRGWAVMREELSRVRAEMRPVVERELAAAVAGLLDVDLGEVVRGGWRSYAKLISAARATVDNPGTTEVVALATHRITASHTPHVDLVIDEVKVATVEVTVEVVIDVEGLLATVYGGRLVNLHSGRCQVRATLHYAGVELASGTAAVDATQIASLGAGIDLLSDHEPPVHAAHGYSRR
jgi:hypothetical protein